ncbi:hypothetical protein HX744_03410 [Pseudonocardia sp. ICBG1122]|nr:hypothetical protein [Pseudonocardia pini]
MDDQSREDIIAPGPVAQDLGGGDLFVGFLLAGLPVGQGALDAQLTGLVGEPGPHRERGLAQPQVRRGLAPLPPDPQISLRLLITELALDLGDRDVLDDLRRRPMPVTDLTALPVLGAAVLKDPPTASNASLNGYFP